MWGVCDHASSVLARPELAPGDVATFAESSQLVLGFGIRTPTSEQDVEHLVGAQHSAVPGDVTRKAVEQPLASVVGPVLVEQPAAGRVFAGVREVGAPQDRVLEAVASEQRLDRAAESVRLQLAPEEDRDHLVLADRAEQLHDRTLDP